MKKCVLSLIVACLIFAISGCSQTADNTEEMLRIIAEEEGISDELEIQTIGTVDLGQMMLVCAMTGNENQGHQYLAAEFQQEKDRYVFVKSYKPFKRGTDMYSLMWADGYVFISNNENSRSLQIRFPNGEQPDELVSVDQVPFVYYLDLSEADSNETSYSFDYYFLNENGEPMWQ